MKRFIALAAVGLLALGMNDAVAGEDSELVVEGEKIVTKAKAPAGSPFDEVISGWRFRKPETQALQTGKPSMAPRASLAPTATATPPKA